MELALYMTSANSLSKLNSYGPSGKDGHRIIKNWASLDLNKSTFNQENKQYPQYHFLIYVLFYLNPTHCQYNYILVTLFLNKENKHKE